MTYQLIDDKNKQIDALVNALELMMEEKRDYMRINYLGDPENTHTIQLAKQAILLVKG